VTSESFLRHRAVLLDALGLLHVSGVV
jgi:hypothetical protein